MSTTGPSTSNRNVLIGLLVLIAIYAAIRSLLNPIFVSDPQPAEPAAANQLADRLDPNLADAASLSALPQLGAKRARQMVDYRQQQQTTHPGTLVYRNAADLLKLKGFGIATTQQLEPYLIFPTTAPTTQASTRIDDNARLSGHQ